MSKPTVTHTDFRRVHTLAQTVLNVEFKITEGANGPGISWQGQTITELLEPGVLWLKCPADQKVLLLDISPHIYFETDDLIGTDGVLIRLAQITDQELGQRLSDALSSCQPPLPSRE